MTKIKRKVFDVYCFPGVLRGYVWEIDYWDCVQGSKHRQYEVELPLGEILESIDYMASVSTAIVNHYEPIFNEKIYLIPVDFQAGELLPEQE